MVAKSSAKLEELSTTSVSDQDLLTQVIAFKQQELKRLQTEVLAETNLKVTIRQEAEQLRMQATQDVALMKQQAQSDQAAGWQQIADAQKSHEYRAMELEGRAKEVEALEATAEPIRQAQVQLNDDRLAMEQQRLRNEALHAENDRLTNQNSSFYEDVRRREALVITEETANRAKATELDQRESALQQRTEADALQLANLDALKATIDPKLKEITRLSEQADATHAQAVILHDATLAAQATLDQQRTDLSILSSQLKAKADALSEYDAQLRRTSAELGIKIQQSGLTVTLPEAPTL